MEQVKMKDCTKMRVGELEAELIFRMLGPSGLKPALVARLLIADLKIIRSLLSTFHSVFWSREP